MKYLMIILGLLTIFTIGTQLGMRKMIDDRDYYRTAYYKLAGATDMWVNPLDGEVEPIRK